MPGVAHFVSSALKQSAQAEEGNAHAVNLGVDYSELERLYLARWEDMYSS
jgi:hypothetical protein